MVSKPTEPEMMMPRMSERPLWPIQVVAQCPKCCKDLVCEPAPVAPILDPKAPPIPPMFALTCLTDGCGYTFISPTRIPIIDHRTQRPAAWSEVLASKREHRCASCREIFPPGAKKHRWADRTSTCETCGGPEAVE